MSETKTRAVYYVNIACYVTKERPEMGFSPTATVPVRVEAETPEMARQKVGDLISRLIAGEDARAKAIKELDELTKEAREMRFGSTTKGDPNVR